MNIGVWLGEKCLVNGRKAKCLVYLKALQIKQLKPCEGKRPITLSGYMCAHGDLIQNREDENGNWETVDCP